MTKRTLLYYVVLQVLKGNDLVIIAILNFAHFILSSPPPLNCASGATFLLPSVSIILSKSSPQNTVIPKAVSSSTKKHNNYHNILYYTQLYPVLSYRHHKFIILIAIVNIHSIRYCKPILSKKFSEQFLFYCYHVDFLSFICDRYNIFDKY